MKEFKMEKIAIQKMANTRTFYEFNETNEKNERLTVEITECYYGEDSSLPKLWKQHGYTKKLYTNALMVDCYCYDKNGHCYEKYNPTIKLSHDKKRNIINFSWLLEVSETNKEKLLKEIYKRFMGGK